MRQFNNISISSRLLDSIEQIFMKENNSNLYVRFLEGSYQTNLKLKSDINMITENTYIHGGIRKLHEN